MEWLREWIIQIAGIILICSVCDIVVTEGAMKKYIKPILGFVLTVIFLRPLIGNIDDKICLSEFACNTEESFESKFNEAENQALKKLYEAKLESKISAELKNIYSGKADIKVVAYPCGDSFGEIEKVEVDLKDSSTANTQNIKNYLSKMLDVTADRIVIL